MTEKEQIEEALVHILASVLHRQFSDLINIISEATPMQVLRMANLSETSYKDLEPTEKICYMKIAMIELEQLRPLLPAYLESLGSNVSPILSQENDHAKENDG